MQYFYPMSPDWIAYGYVGLFLGSFVAATLLPFPSEALLITALELELPVMTVLLVATAGNFLGGITNYELGYLAANRKFLAVIKVNHNRVKRWEAKSNRWGYWLGFLAWIPIIGDPMLLALGFLKTRFLPLCVTVLIGKFVRYGAVTLLYFG